MGVLSVQLTPESVDVKTRPKSEHATSLAPAADEDTDHQP
jgi:hypothetical protein